MAKVLSLPAGEYGQLRKQLSPVQRTALDEGMSAEQRETLIALDNPRQVVQNELLQSRVLRAIYSQRQLQEVMTDFWLNHFNVFQIENLITHGQVSEKTRALILQQLATAPVAKPVAPATEQQAHQAAYRQASLTAGLLFGSPDFQHR